MIHSRKRNIGVTRAFFPKLFDRIGIHSGFRADLAVLLKYNNARRSALTQSAYIRRYEPNVVIIAFLHAHYVLELIRIACVAEIGCAV